MKKITLILLCLISFSAFSQELISFETGEGYSPGTISGQNGWTVSQFNGNNDITNQLVNTDAASDGTASLKVDFEPAFGSQPSNNTGAFYTLSSPLDASTATISFDMNISQLNGSIFEVGFDNTAEDATITSIAINVDGSVNVYANTSASGGTGTIIFADTGQDLAINTWYNFRLEMNGSAIEVFMDDVSIYSGFVGTPNIDILRAVCVHNNNGGFFYFDNFRINNEVLSVDELDKLAYNFRYASSTKEILLESPSALLDELRVYNMLGQQVIQKSLNGNSERLNVQQLPNGVYVAQVNMEGKIETFKFSKN